MLMRRHSKGYEEMKGQGTISSTFLVLIVCGLLANVEGGRSLHGFKRPLDSTDPPPLPPWLSLPPHSALAGVRGYGRFHANDSFIGRRVPCSLEERTCFRFNLLYDPKTERCHPVGGGYAPGCDLMPNRTEYERGSGHVVGACREYQDPCTGYRMAYNGRCYWKKIVRSVMCGCQSKPTRHFLGGVECRCAPSAPVLVEQPQIKTQCNIPDLRYPVDRSYFFNLHSSSLNASRNASSLSTTSAEFHSQCSPRQRDCFSKGLVWVNNTEGCFFLLQQGPCARGQVVVMSHRSWVRDGAVCSDVRGGCRPGERRMAFDGRCHNEREMILLAPGRIELDIFGEYVVVNYTEVRSYSPAIFNDACVIFSANSFSRTAPAVHVLKPPCNANNVCYFDEGFADLPPAEPHLKDYDADNAIQV